MSEREAIALTRGDVNAVVTTVEKLAGAATSRAVITTLDDARVRVACEDDTIWRVVEIPNPNGVVAERAEVPFSALVDLGRQGAVDDVVDLPAAPAGDSGPPQAADYEEHVPVAAKVDTPFALATLAYRVFVPATAATVVAMTAADEGDVFRDADGAFHLRVQASPDVAPSTWVVVPVDAEEYTE